jgi:hypothetical protein
MHFTHPTHLVLSPNSRIGKQSLISSRSCLNGRQWLYDDMINASLLMVVCSLGASLLIVTWQSELNLRHSSCRLDSILEPVQHICRFQASLEAGVRVQSLDSAPAGHTRIILSSSSRTALVAPNSSPNFYCIRHFAYYRPLTQHE